MPDELWADEIEYVRLILQVTHPLRTFGLLVRVFFPLPSSGGESLLDREPDEASAGRTVGSGRRSGRIWILGTLIDEEIVSCGQESVMMYVDAGAHEVVGVHGRL